MEEDRNIIKGHGIGGDVNCKRRSRFDDEVASTMEKLSLAVKLKGKQLVKEDGLVTNMEKDMMISRRMVADNIYSANFHVNPTGSSSPSPP